MESLFVHSKIPLGSFPFSGRENRDMEVWERITGSQKWALNIEWGAGRAWSDLQMSCALEGSLNEWYCGDDLDGGENFI